MPDTQITDEMVRVALDAYQNAEGSPLEGPPDVCMRAALEAALSGHVVVPREPTEAMLSAGDSMMPQIAAGQDITTGYDALKEAWPAMIQAAHVPVERG